MSIVPQRDKELIESYQKQNVEDAFEYRNQSKAPKSLVTYNCAWKKFTKWCDECGYDPFAPPNNSYEFLVALFITSMAKNRKLKDASITCYLAGLRHFYCEKGVNLDTTHSEISKIRAGIKRELGTKQNQKLPLTTENIKLLIDSIGRLVWPIEVRDKAMILVGFSGAFRRSELVAIDLEHLVFDQFGASVFVAKSKTDQEMQGRFVDIPFASNPQYCPVRALRDWIRCAKIEKGPLFLQVHKGGNVIPKRLGDRSVALMLKRRCKPFGFSDDIAGHSLRAGHVTSAIKNGTPETWIMRQTGHTNIDTLRKYERLKREFEANSAATIGL